MWKNSMKNVESDNKILYETLLNFFNSEMVLTFWISLVYTAQAVAKATQSFYKLAMFPNSAFPLPLLKHRDICHTVYCENTY